VSYVDAFAIVWALCPAGLTFAFTREVPILGRGINALQVGAEGGWCGFGNRAKVSRATPGHCKPAAPPPAAPPHPILLSLCSFITQPPCLHPHRQNIYLPKTNDKAKGASSMVDALRKRAATRGMPPFVIAPEGTLSHGRCLLAFKT
jgi:hypothetical protein